MKRLVQLWCALALLLFYASPAFAQTNPPQREAWSELRTQRFAILYEAPAQATAEEYAGFVDAIYDEVSAVFSHAVATPVRLRLYSTLEQYYAVNPLARGLPGIVAHADYRRHEVVVILPQTRSQTFDEIQNNIRHELTHIVASDLSENRLNVLFHEGIAQYVEHPSRELETKISLLQRAHSANQLLSWSDLDNRDLFYRNSQITYPQSLSIVAFLVDRYSFNKLRELLTITARSSGYRSALERTYGVAVDLLEQEWAAWLPGYLEGGYRRHALTAYDLSPSEQLLQQGRYAEAQRELETALQWLRETDQADLLAHAELLLEYSQLGQTAERLAREAHTALVEANYAHAAGLVAQAQEIYADINDTRREPVLNEYAMRADRGLRAIEALQQGRRLLEAWRYLQARELLDQATAEFIALGDTERANEARALRAVMDQRQLWLGLVLLALGIGGAVVSLLRFALVREAESW